ncbi:MAG: GAF domain-containing protein, partial [Candidatus Omnitrophica bacterium]|nr:GAF domain-containing protein [Candidatus Omnitrophota bacterium]
MLAGFFICANKFNSQLFLLIGVLQVISLIILFWFRSYLEKELTSIKIKREEYLEKINLLNLDIEKENLTKQSLFERIAAYAKLKNLAESLSLAATCSEAAGIIAGKTDELLGSQDATTILYLFDPKTGEFGLVSAVKSGTKVRVLLKTGDSFDRWVIKNLKPLLVEDAKSDFRFDEGKNILNDNERIKRSLISTPLIVGDKVLGILRIDSINENRFSAEDLRFLSRIGDLGAVAIESAQLYEHVQDLAIKDSLTGLYLRRHLLER